MAPSVAWVWRNSLWRAVAVYRVATAPTPPHPAPARRVRIVSR